MTALEHKYIHRIHIAQYAQISLRILLLLTSRMLKCRNISFLLRRYFKLPIRYFLPVNHLLFLCFVRFSNVALIDGVLFARCFFSLLDTVDLVEFEDLAEIEDALALADQFEGLFDLVDEQVFFFGEFVGCD